MFFALYSPAVCEKSGNSSIFKQALNLFKNIGAFYIFSDFSLDER
ncbi:hypothetical protein ANACOL_01459 [Anaerotruncus colihominis DSM 17241]|uniref:Uncharacterized protein n=1 Tax=Anaerotruncus colihominis DSM 17241 TaxID=445972 RepID=B0P9J1_9FIRM|nr:hypothetical protein ANACOL_01459 [Anaerotruncus colihominis DSM 17241]